MPGRQSLDRGLNTVFDADLVRTLCQEILGEKDPQRLEELLTDLRTVVKRETEEVRGRVHYLVQKYADVLRDEPSVVPLNPSAEIS
jgi:polyhydroxyalkanoate synthesis regulator phasin